MNSSKPLKIEKIWGKEISKSTHSHNKSVETQEDNAEEKEENLDDAIDWLKFERARHLKGKFVQTIKDWYMKDSSFGLQQYKSKLRYIRDNEALLRSTDGIKQLSESLGYKTEDMK